MNKYKYHLLFWSIFIAYEALIARLLKLGKEESMLKYVLYYFNYIFPFYFHAHVLLKYVLNNKNRLVRYSLAPLIVLELIFFFLIRFLIEKYYSKYAEGLNIELNTYGSEAFIRAVWRSIYFIGISTVYFFLIHDRQQRQQIEKMKQQELKAILLEKEIKNELISTQNAFLRAQINPHFLINTLSYLYNVTRKSVPGAANSILSLSEIMQYALSKDMFSEYVRLENEIRLVESFLLLHQAKKKNILSI
ncbi:histidine kinase [Pedobacter sp. NJ-S-72]